MPHPGKAERRKARRSKSAARKLARAKGTDSGAFSETGFFEADKPVSVAKRIQIAAKGVFQAPKKAAVREGLRRAAGGKPPTRLQIARSSIEGTLVAGIPGARSTSLLGIFGRFARTAGPGIGVRLAGRAVGPTVAAAAGGAVGAIVERKLAERGQQMPHRGAGKPTGGLLPGVGGALPSKDTVVKVWTTGTANFARLLDGRIAVQKKDGTIKTYRPQKHIVIPRNPRVGTLIRADKRLERLTKGLRKVVRTGKR